MSTRQTLPETNESALLRLAQEERGRYIAEYADRATAAIGRFLRNRVIGPIARRRHYRQQKDQLIGMDDHMLHDLGITRGEISYVMSHGRHVDVANSNAPKGGTSAAA